MFNWFKKRSDTPQTPSIVATDKSLDELYSTWRQSALSMTRAKMGVAASPLGAPAWGVVMDFGHDKATITLFTLIDGTTSIYFSTGAGVLGGHGHKCVRQANAAFIAEANRSLALLKPCDECPIPATGQVVFYVLTDSGILTGGALRNDLGYRRHPLANLFHAGDDVITQMRLVSQAAEKAPENN